MDYLPVFARLTGQPCLVIGGGAVAARKASLLYQAAAKVTVRAPVFCDRILRLAQAGDVQLEYGQFSSTDNDDYLLVIAATDAAAINHRVAAWANRHRILCNVVDDADASSFIMPAVVDRSPVQIAISTGGHSPVLARRLKAQLERLLPARLGDVAQLLGKFRSAAKKRFANIGERRRFWEHLLDADVLTAAVDRDATGSEAAVIIGDALAAAVQPRAGIGYLIGAGPGDPDLMTVRAQRLLADVDVVLYDRLVGRAVLDRARRDADFVDVGKAPGGKAMAQHRINELLVSHVAAGKRVARLKGGDPFIFGRGGEELAALRDAGLAVQVVPGISAAQGCAASIGLPLTQRGVHQALTLVTAHSAEGESPRINWDALCASDQMLVFYMGVARLRDIRRNLLLRLAPTTPVTVVEKGTTPEQRVHRTVLAALDEKMGDAVVQAPALVFVGTTARTSTVEWDVA